MKQGRCKHFNGIQHARCKAGILYDDVIPNPDQIMGKGLRLPCTTFSNKLSESQLEHVKNKGVCGSYEEPSSEDLEASEAEWEETLLKIRKAQPLIAELKKKHPEGGGGTVPCPVCEGVLYYSISSCNGHCHGKCETDKCFFWME